MNSVLQAMCTGLFALLVPPPLNAQLRPIDWSVTRDASPIEIGKPFPVLVHATIPHSWHLYSTTQPVGGPIATAFTSDNRADFSVERVVPGRKPDTANDRSFSMPTETFSDSVTFAVWLVARNAGKQRLAITVSFQACTNRLCLPPTSESLKLPVNVARPAPVARPSDPSRLQ